MVVASERAAFDGFGTPPGIEEGAEFPNRTALRAAGIHRPLQAGISGAKGTGAESIVLSGGYEDDEDYGDVIIYTGHGGRDESGRQVSDQNPNAAGNAALITSAINGVPVRVARGSRHPSPDSPSSGYRYGGLYRVESYWQERGKHGFLICRYRMVKTPVTPELDGTSDTAAPARRAVTTQRVVRSSAVVERVKALHDHTCQICGTRLSAHGRGYSEGAHIRPLGRPHDGPDTEENLLCLCANCHVLFDLGAIVVSEDLQIYTEESQVGILRVVSGHRPSKTHLGYHRRLHSSQM